MRQVEYATSLTCPPGDAFTLDQSEQRLHAVAWLQVAEVGTHTAVETVAVADPDDDLWSLPAATVLRLHPTTANQQGVYMTSHNQLRIDMMFPVFA